MIKWNEVFNLVQGERCEPTIDLGGYVCDANDGTALVRRRGTLPQEVERAMGIAERVHAQQTWSARSPEQRAEALETIANQLQRRVNDIAEADARTTGVVIETASGLAKLTSLTFRAAAELLREGFLGDELPGKYGPVRIERHPRGPAVVLAPWNAPGPIAAHKVASALAAGCPVVLKPSEFAPHSCTVMAEAIEEAGVLPPGTFALVHGDKTVGGQLVTDPRTRAVSFTGGLVAGRAIAEACGRELKPAQLELGGNNPLLALEDADIDRVATGVVRSLTTLNGQWCRALGRLIVPHAMVRDLLDAVEARLGELKLWHSLSPTAQMGPLAHARHRQTVLQAIDELRQRGGDVRQPTPLPALSGYFVSPTIVTGVRSEHAVEEIFGPVCTVHPYEHRDEAIALANATPYGLAAYVFGEDEDAAFAVASKIRAGSIKVNAAELLGLHPRAPRPAWGLSGLGDEGTAETLGFFCGSKVIGLAAPSGGVA